MIDLLENHGLNTKLGSIKFLVLDEADRLLDAGFKREIERIIQTLPNRNDNPRFANTFSFIEWYSRCYLQRQTLLFSATIPPDVHKIAQMALLPSHQNISTLSETDIATHAHVKQHALVVPHTELFPVLARLLSQWMREDPRAKVMVFANTARATGLFAQMVCQLPGLHLLMLMSDPFPSLENSIRRSVSHCSRSTHGSHSPLALAPRQASQTP